MNEITAQKPLILNFDQSVHLASAQTIELTEWQESIRFGSSMKNFDALRQALNHQMPNQYGPVFMGSGDYHHITLLLLERLLAKQSNNLTGTSTDQQPIDLIVFDNHPDNMRFPFGIHCGSWVFHAAKLPQIRHIHVIGITSNDIGFAHAIENHFRPLYRNKLTYWSMQVNTQWAHSIGLKKAFKSFASPDHLIDCFLQTMKNEPHNLYLSIDKDAFSRDVIQTNWNQGILEEHHLWQVIDGLKPRIIAADITGEVSEYHYQTPWKRFLSRLDQQAPIPPESLTAWQTQQNAFNTKIIARLK